jgi:hypothetical protein
MIVEGPAIGELPGETVRAVNGLGRKVVGAVQGHQQLVVQDPKWRQQVVRFQALNALNKHRIECARGERIEQRSDLISTGNLRHAQQRVGVILALGLLQPALLLQKRRRLGKEDAKGTESGIGDTVSGVWPFVAIVRQGLDVAV